MEQSVRAYLESVVLACADVLGENLSSTWIIGSLVTGDFDIRRSDIDLIVTCADVVGDEAKQALALRLSHGSLPCPAHGVDLLIYRASEVRELCRAPHYEFSISSGVDWTDDVSWGGPYPGGLIDLATVRQLGTAIRGASPEEVVGECPDEWILEELANGMRWHTTRIHDPFHDPTGSNAVLNGCRALHFRAHRVFTSKSAGARWFLSTEPRPVVAEALAEREVPSLAHRLDEAAVLSFLQAVIRDFDPVSGIPDG